MSVTKSFGRFSGGKLRYFPDDDGHTPLENMPSKHAHVVDTARELCLFDGRRAHEVEPFEGFRYSLVYFTQQRYKAAGPESLRALARLGAPNPTKALLAHFGGLLAPPRGYDGGTKQNSIERALCGVAELPQYLCSPSSTWDSLPAGALDNSFTFVISPQAMSTFCAVCHKTHRSCWRNGSWRGTIVDPPLTARPKGTRAYAHYKLWSACLGVRVQDWMFSSVSFLLNGQLEPWQWGRSIVSGETWQSCRGHRLLVSRQPVRLSNVNVRIEINRGDPTAALVLGLSDAENPAELMRLLLDKKDRQQRGPRPDIIDVDLNLYYVCFGTTSRKKCLGWNGRAITAGASSPRLATLDGAIVSFGVKGKRLVATSTNKTPFQLGGSLPRSAVVQSDCPHYAVVIAAGEDNPRLAITPFLNTKPAIAQGAAW